MGINSGSLSRRIQIQRQTATPDGYGGEVLTWSDLGSSISARRRDVADSERKFAGGWDNRLVSRFVVRSTAFSRGIRRTDRLVHEGITFEIDGIKEVPDSRAFLEITAMTEEPL